MRVLALWLDGFGMGLADDFELPVLTSLRDRSAWATVDHGHDYRTGLAGEHLSTGLDPHSGGGPSPIGFDVDTYACWQLVTSLPPIFGGVPTVVLDPSYFDLETAPPSVQGIVDWGAHDPGAPPRDRPAGLRNDILERFGPYPAHGALYSTPWASTEACAETGAALTRAVQCRSDLARWLLRERLPDWDLALVTVSEAHSGTEALYHGVDPSPRFASCASRGVAREGLRAVYEAIDTMVGDLLATFPDAAHIVFAMHGMGANHTDVPSMALLGELLRRWCGDETPDGAFELDASGLPQLAAGRSWDQEVRKVLDGPTTPRARPSVLRRVARRVDRVIGRGQPAQVPVSAPTKEGELSLSWMPLMRHQRHWPRMRAFALPTFSDGRIRLNVRGRESSGQIDPADYASVLDEIEELLAECTDPLSGEPVVAATHRPGMSPSEVDPTDADLIVTWRPEVHGIRHPRLGTIGPLPPRRTGGHTSPLGRCFVHGPGIEPGHLGTRSAFDVVPTILAMSGSTPLFTPSGEVLPIPGTWANAEAYPT